MAFDSIAWLALAAGSGLVLGLAVGSSAGYHRLRLLRDRIERYHSALLQAREQHDLLDERSRAGELRAGVLATRVENLERQLVERERRAVAHRDENGKLQRDLIETRTALKEREEQHTRQLQLMAEGRDALKREFENLANRIFEERGRQLASANNQSLEALLKPFREQLDGFRSRVDQLHSESVRGQGLLEAEIKKVLEIGLHMSEEATNLSLALRGDKKTAGNWGEAQLERSLQLAGLEPGEHDEAQSALRDAAGRQRYPDFVIRLPDDKHLVIDSKVSLVDYDRAVAASSAEERAIALDAHAAAVLNHVNDLAKKDYASLPGVDSPDFVLMFMPVEPAYIEALRHNRELYNHGYERGVILVSHTTLMPILRTVANLWMIARSNTEAREISHRAGDLYQQVCRLARRLQRLGQSLNTANGHYNEAVRSLVGKQGLQGKVERFRQITPAANRSLPDVHPVTSEADHHALKNASGVLEPVPDAPQRTTADGQLFSNETDPDQAPT